MFEGRMSLLLALFRRLRRSGDDRSRVPVPETPPAKVVPHGGDGPEPQAHPETSGLLARMMSAHGLSTGPFALRHPVEVRRMIRACADCSCKARCRTDLDRGVARATAAEYCPNCDQFC